MNGQKLDKVGSEQAAADVAALLGSDLGTTPTPIVGAHLADLIPNLEVERSLLAAAYNVGAARDLKGVTDATAAKPIVATLMGRMTSRHYTKDGSRFAIGCWARALGAPCPVSKGRLTRRWNPLKTFTIVVTAACICVGLFAVSIYMDDDSNVVAANTSDDERRKEPIETETLEPMPPFKEVPRDIPRVLHEPTTDVTPVPLKQEPPIKFPPPPPRNLKTPREQSKVRTPAPTPRDVETKRTSKEPIRIRERAAPPKTPRNNKIAPTDPLKPTLSPGSTNSRNSRQRQKTLPSKRRSIEPQRSDREPVRRSATAPQAPLVQSGGVTDEPSVQAEPYAVAIQTLPHYVPELGATLTRSYFTMEDGSHFDLLSGEVSDINSTESFPYRGSLARITKATPRSFHISWAYRTSGFWVIDSYLHDRVRDTVSRYVCAYDARSQKWWLMTRAPFLQAPTSAPRYRLSERQPATYRMAAMKFHRPNGADTVISFFKERQTTHLATLR